MQSLAYARLQGAKGWELRTTTTLARARMMQGRETEARHLLAAMYEQFTEGFATHDLDAARQLLRELERKQLPSSLGDVEDRDLDDGLAAMLSLDHAARPVGQSVTASTARSTSAARSID